MRIPPFLYFGDEPYATVKAYILGSSVWFVIGTVMGFVDATHFVVPDLFSDIPWLTMSRVRAMHMDAVIYGFAGTGLQGAAYYIVPALARSPLWSEKLGLVSSMLWNFSIAAGEITLAYGLSQGREYAEWIWPIDILVLIGLALLFFNLFMTVLHRKEKVLYVSNWYILAGIIYIFLIYFFGNAVWNFNGAIKGGMQDAMLAWFYGHGIVGLYLTPLAIAVSYYIVPVVTRSPLYSHSLSLVGFWSILFIYTHIGTHHLLQTPEPTWLKVIAITGSIAMFIPVFTVLINLWLTMRGRLGHIHADIGGKFVMAGLVWYLIVCIQGPLQALPIVQRITHLNNWVIGHAHIAVLGFAGFIAVGGFYFIVPRVSARPIYSPRLADVQYWLMLIGITAFFFILTPAGLIQGNTWLNGETVYKVLPEIYPYMVLRASTGLLIVFGAMIGLYNLYMSLYGPQPAEETS